MLPATSTIPAFKLALKEALEARPGLSGVQVTYGSPLPSPSAEFVWLQGVSGEQTARAIGKLSRRERLRLAVQVSVLHNGQDQQIPTERAFELVAEIEECLRQDPTLDATYAGEGQIGVAEVAGDFELMEIVSQDGMTREARIDFGINWESRI